jgi:glycine/D-amino acid oxidase-like deaminating enzyme
MFLAQSCHLPVSSDGLPIMGKLPDVTGAYVATGHGCWGILNSPATGRVCLGFRVCKV